MRAASSKYDGFNRLAQLLRNLRFQLLNTGPSVHYCRFGVLCAPELIIFNLISINFQLKLIFPFGGGGGAAFGFLWRIPALRTIFDVKVNAFIYSELI